MESKSDAYWKNLPEEDREKIKYAIRKHIRSTIGYDALAGKLRIKPQSLYDKISQLKFSAKSVKQWSRALGCSEALFYLGTNEEQVSYTDLVIKVKELERRIEMLEAKE